MPVCLLFSGGAHQAVIVSRVGKITPRLNHVSRQGVWGGSISWPKPPAQYSLLNNNVQLYDYGWERGNLTRLLKSE